MTRAFWIILIVSIVGLIWYFKTKKPETIPGTVYDPCTGINAENLAKCQTEIITAPPRGNLDCYGSDTCPPG